MAEQRILFFPPFRLVAEFADGSRHIFDGMTEADAMAAMEAAQEAHGDIVWYDGVTDEHYENGTLYRMTPDPPLIDPDKSGNK